MTKEELEKRNREYLQLLKEIFYEIDSHVKTATPVTGPSVAVLTSGPSRETLLSWWERIQKIMTPARE